MKPEDDVISLVDVAVIFVRRWVAFVTVFFVVLAIGIGYAFTLKDTSTVVYTTTVQPAAIPGKNDSAAALQTLVETKWIAAAKEEYEHRHGDSAVPIKPQQIQGTRLIELVSRGPNLRKQAVVDFHQVLAELVVREQNAALNSRVSMFEEQLKSNEAIIQRAKNLPHPADIRMNMRLKNNLEFAEVAEILMLASEKRVVNKAPSRKLAVVLSVVIGLLLGCLAPFVAEFICQVRNRLRELRTEQGGS